MTKYVDTLKKVQGEEVEELNIQLAARIDDLLSFLGHTLDNGYHYDQEGIRGPALCHKGDNPTAFRFYSNTGIWSCWTHGCNRTYGNDMIGLIKCCKEVNFDSAVIIAKKFLRGKKLNKKEIEERKKQRGQVKLVKKQNAWREHIEQKIYSEGCLKMLKDPAKFCAERKLDYATVRSYGIGIGQKSTLNKRVVCPMRNVKGKIIGFSGRLIIPGSPKWIHHGFKKNYNLFNVERLFKLSIENSIETAIICEGPFDVIKLVMAGINNAVAICGSAINDGQIEILRRIGISKLILAFDGDTAGEVATQKTLKNLEKNLFDLGTIYIGEHIREIYGDKWDYKQWGDPDWGHEKVTIEMIQSIFKEVL
jgi:5S rRNA maturation endonuclease (ribonuclease M5)